jgi:hypothetical protein
MYISDAMDHTLVRTLDWFRRRAGVEYPAAWNTVLPTPLPTCCLQPDTFHTCKKRDTGSQLADSPSPSCPGPCHPYCAVSRRKINKRAMQPCVVCKQCAKASGRTQNVYEASCKRPRFSTVPASKQRSLTGFSPCVAFLAEDPM